MNQEDADVLTYTLEYGVGNTRLQEACKREVNALRGAQRHLTEVRDALEKQLDPMQRVDNRTVLELVEDLILDLNVEHDRAVSAEEALANAGLGYKSKLKQPVDTKMLGLLAREIFGQSRSCNLTEEEETELYEERGEKFLHYIIAAILSDAAVNAGDKVLNCSTTRAPKDSVELSRDILKAVLDVAVGTSETPFRCDIRDRSAEDKTTLDIFQPGPPPDGKVAYLVMLHKAMERCNDPATKAGFFAVQSYLSKLFYDVAELKKEKERGSNNP